MVPWSEEATELDFLSAIVFPLTEPTEPVRSTFLEVPYPITTISSRVFVSSWSTMSKYCFPRVCTSLSAKPRQETSRAGPLDGISISKVPSTSVMTPVFVPLMRTPAPISGSPSGPVTFPFTFMGSFDVPSPALFFPRFCFMIFMYLPSSCHLRFCPARISSRTLETETFLQSKETFFDTSTSSVL